MKKPLISNSFVRGYLLGIIEKIEAVDTEDAVITVGAIRTALDAVKGVRIDG